MAGSGTVWDAAMMASAGTEHRSYRVLLVDDSLVDRRLIAKLLADCPTSRFEVVTAATAVEALEAVHADPYDLAFLDFYLDGGEDCTELIRALRQAEYRLPIVVLTGATDPTVVEQCLASGADDYINKSGMSAQLFDHTVRHAIKRRADELRLRNLAHELGQRNAALEDEIARGAELERERDRLQGRLEMTRRMETVGQLASGVAHEFNNVLATINGYAELMSTMELRPDQVRTYAAEVATAGRRGAELTAKLSSFARDTRARGRRLDLGEVVEERLQDYRDRETGRVAFRLTRPDGPIPTEADPGQVNLVLDSVLKNACEAIIAGGEIDLDVAMETLDQGACRLLSDWIAPDRYWRVRVRDTGVGMSRYVLDRIYEPFFTTKDVGEGSGLGMAAVVRGHEVTPRRSARGVRTGSRHPGVPVVQGTQRARVAAGGEHPAGTCPAATDPPGRRRPERPGRGREHAARARLRGAQRRRWPGRDRRLRGRTRSLRSGDPRPAHARHGRLRDLPAAHAAGSGGRGADLQRLHT
jgi:signal transduction histidine kinase